MITQINLRNLGTINKNVVTLKNEKNQTITLYFSYETIIAVGNKVCTNNWGPTTGKLLNELEPNKKNRVPHEELITHLQKLLINF